MFVVTRRPIGHDHILTLGVYSDEIGANLLVKVLKKARYSDDFVYNIREGSEDE